MNVLTVSGNLGRDPELKTSNNGTEYCTFSIAIRDWRNKDAPTWLQVVLFGKSASYAAKLAKGDSVYLSGRLVVDEYVDKQGVNRKSAKIIASEVEGRSASGNGSVPSGSFDQSVGSMLDKPAETPAAQPITDDDIPF